ncbi:MAG TPA: hypothetical protein VJ903_05575 [Clostridia bacterium]|nr:hypothetical protein [Clostridia bacterium]
MLFGNPIFKNAADKVVVRDPSNFNWTFIALLAVVFYIYWTEIRKKNYKAVIAGIALYSVHWFYEIMNAIIAAGSGYALWTVSNASTSFVLLIGVSWELSMMFSIAGIIAFKMLPDDRTKRFLATEKFKGVSCKLATAIGMALMFSVIEIFLAWTPAFIWVYKWWGAIPVFITTYIPFFLASNYVPDMKPKTQIILLGSLASVNILLLAILVPLGII